MLETKKQASIPYSIKHQCVALHKSGKTNREIYNYFLSQTASKQNFVSFKRSMAKWKNNIQVDDKFVKDTEILHGVNLGLGFHTNKATVQFNAQTKEVERVWARIAENEVSDTDRLIKVIENLKQIEIDIEPVEVKDKRMYEIPLFDMHFGISDYEHYKQTQFDIIENLNSHTWEEVLIVMGQDMLHTDNFRGQTASGTMIGEIDLVKAWKDCHKFYAPIIELSLKLSNKVKIIYSVGNHDESMSWAFVQFIKALYPQCEYDDCLEYYKEHTFGKNFIGFTHGEEARKLLHVIFPIEFPMQWASANTREIHCGHLHREALDTLGTVVRSLSTKNKTDKYHKKHGYVGNHKRFETFEWSEFGLKSIHYV